MTRPTRLLLAATAALLSPTASAIAASPLVTQTSMSDVVLGSPPDIAYDVFGAHPSRTRTGKGTRLVFPQPVSAGRPHGAIVVYLDRTSRIRAIVATDPRWLTAERVGPCSSVARLRAVYGSRLQRTRAGRTSGYRLGTLFFATHKGTVRYLALSETADLLPAVTRQSCGP